MLKKNYKESIGRAWNNVISDMDVDEHVNTMFEKLVVVEVVVVPQALLRQEACTMQ